MSIRLLIAETHRLFRTVCDRSWSGSRISQSLPKLRTGVKPFIWR